MNFHDIQSVPIKWKTTTCFIDIHHLVFAAYPISYSIQSTYIIHIGRFHLNTCSVFAFSQRCFSQRFFAFLLHVFMRLISKIRYKMRERKKIALSTTTTIESADEIHALIFIVQLFCYDISKIFGINLI